MVHEKTETAAGAAGLGLRTLALVAPLPASRHRVSVSTPPMSRMGHDESSGDAALCETRESLELRTPVARGLRPYAPCTFMSAASCRRSSAILSSGGSRVPSTRGWLAVS